MIEIGHATVPMPRFSIIYVKQTERTPKNITITFTFPDGQEINYESENVIIEEFTKEYIVEKRLFPYIPFYIARYETEIASEGNIPGEGIIVNIRNGENIAPDMIKKSRNKLIAMLEELLSRKDVTKKKYIL